MTSTADKPIDTHLIGIVYDAIRRDLGRAFDTLSTPIDARRRVLLRTTSSGLLPFSAATTPVKMRVSGLRSDSAHPPRSRCWTSWPLVMSASTTRRVLPNARPAPTATPAPWGHATTSGGRWSDFARSCYPRWGVMKMKPHRSWPQLSQAPNGMRGSTTSSVPTRWPSSYGRGSGSPTVSIPNAGPSPRMPSVYATGSSPHSAFVLTPHHRIRVL
ncbi:hypothetical protein SAMN04490239_0099 [Rhodococcus koreensis]|uniref:Uncharacterized protein n=1 Tax=Rhodococcus koreensis TaxID=99653 RepID=A0A1H4I891_9NOCA|nr:hypothetical protein SAMN04490239_0099 [Rhodococcus koreensis]